MIRWEVRGQVGLATLDRPERRNALSVEMCHQLRTGLAAFSEKRPPGFAGR